MPGWPDDVAESEEETEEAPGGGVGRERAVTAAAQRSQRLGPGPVRLSAPGGCESAAAAAEEELVGGRRAGGSAEDEAAAGRSRRGGGRRAVATTPAPGPGGRARAHGEGESPAGATFRGPLPRSRPRQAWCGLESTEAGLNPVAGRRRLPVGPGGAGTSGAGRRHFRALPGQDSVSRVPGPPFAHRDLNGVPPRGLRGLGEERDERVGAQLPRGWGPQAPQARGW